MIIKEFAFGALIAGIMVTLIQGSLPLAMARFQPHAALAISRCSAFFQAIFICSAFAGFIWAFVESDFTMALVGEHSASTTPLLYKISAVWSGHEGSLFLWLVVMSLYGAGFAFFHPQSLSLQFQTLILSTHAWVTAVFYGLVLYENPFKEAVEIVFEGQDLNPLLQDSAMLFHPPSLYFGYVGFSLIFSLTVAALIKNHFTAAWAQIMRQWVLIVWGIMTFGIGAGSWWAYYELGWGGWWFWDPVENASLMPWLLGLSLLHVLGLIEKEKVSPYIIVLLGVLPFGFSILGTFMVRSGAVHSVHAFAQSTERGRLILGALILIMGIPLILYSLRFSSLRGGVKKNIWSLNRASFLKGSAFLLCLMTGVIMIGTLGPLFISSTQETSVGSQYFITTAVPIGLLTIFLAGIGGHLKETTMNWRQLYGLLHGLVSVSLVGCIIFLYILRPHQFLAGLALIVSFWCIGATLSALWQRRFSLHHVRWGMTLAHIGISVSCLGMATDVCWHQEMSYLFTKGQHTNFAGFKITLLEVETGHQDNYDFEKASFKVESIDGKEIGQVSPEKRYFPLREGTTFETALMKKWFSHLYAALGDKILDNQWVVHFHYHPGVLLIWLGGLMVVFATGIAFFQRHSVKRLGKGMKL